MYTAIQSISRRPELNPVHRPQFVMFPGDTTGFAIDDQFYIGSSGLLVKPVTVKGATETSVYLSDKQPYYDYFSNQLYRGGGRFLTVQAELHQVPVFIRGGSVIPTRERPRRSSPLMKNDPFTLRFALDSTASARGELYLDDGETYQHHKGDFVWREFTAGKQGKALKISSRDLASQNPREAVETRELVAYNKGNAYVKSLKDANVRVERIVIHGLASRPKTVKSNDGTELEWYFEEGVSAVGVKEGASSYLLVKPLGLGITDDWSVLVE